MLLTIKQKKKRTNVIEIIIHLNRDLSLCRVEMINVYVEFDEKKENQCKPAINEIFFR